MPISFTENLLSSTYRDDYKDSNNFHRILFNSGRALQARELTQSQTILHKEIERFGKNIFKEGAAVNPGGILVNRKYEFIKLNTTTNALPTDVTPLIGDEFTSAPTGIKFVVLEIVAATSTDPATLYVRYTDTSGGTAGAEPVRVPPGENITGANSGEVLTVQSTNTTTDKAVGVGTRASVHGGDFFVQGHFVNAQPQSILIDKYGNRPTKKVGFKVIQDVVTTADDDTLFDNQGVLPNKSAPGADRFRIRLELTTQDLISANENFVFMAEVVEGRVMQTVTGFDQYNKINDLLAARTKETNGDFNVKPFLIKFDEDDSFPTKLKLNVSNGIAYVNGYRANQPVPQKLSIDRAQDTVTINNHVAIAQYGNYFDIQGNVATGSPAPVVTRNIRDLPNIGTMERMDLRSSFNYDSAPFQTAAIGTRISAITKANPAVVTVDSASNLITGDKVRITGIVGMTQLNSQEVYARKTSNTQFELYVDPDLQTGLNSSAYGTFSADAGAKIDWGTLGRAHVRYVQNFSTGVYRWYLADIQMNPGKSTRQIRSIGTAQNNVGNIVLDGLTGNAVLKGTTNNSLLFPLPEQRAKTLTDISTEVQRSFIGSLDGSGKFSSTLSASGETFANTAQWVVTSTTIGDHKPRTGSFAISGGGITFEYTDDSGATQAGETVQILAKVAKSQGAVRPKTLQTLELKGLDFDSNGGAEIVPAQITLQKPDLFKVLKILDSSDSSDISDRFIIDNGQRDNFYGPARLVLKGGASRPSGTNKVRAKFQYFTHGASGDFFTSQSYSGQIDYGKIPKHTRADGNVVEVQDFVDFRPRKADANLKTGFSTGFDSATAVVNELPTPTDNIQADVEYYMPRHDKLVIDEGSKVRLLKGTSSLDPKYPELPNNCLELYRIKLNPFTFHDSDLDIDQIEQKNYTMRDIGKLEERIDQVEEMASLSLLEVDLKNLSVLDSTGADRTKAGFLVDNFRDQLASNVGTLEYRASIDPRDQIMRPSFFEDAIGLVYDSAQSTNTRKMGDNIYLKFTEQLFLNQPLYSQTENINPFQVIVHRGRLRISPGSDDWKEVKRLPPRVIDGGFRLNPNQANLWNSWEWAWGGTPLNRLAGRTLQNTSSNSVEVSGNTTRTFRNTQITRVVHSETIREFIEDKVVDVAVIPFARSRKIYFRAQGMRPNTQIFPYFDGIRVDDWVREEPFQNISDDPTQYGTRFNRATTHPEGSSPLIANAAGTIEGSFFLPNTNAVKFRTGERELKFLDITVDNQVDAASIASVVYTSKGILETRQRNFRSTRQLDIVRNTSRTLIAFQQEDDDNNDDGGSDPLAQSFRVVQPNGIFATKVGIRFATKDTVIPVQCQIRPLVNGMPSAEEIVPGAVKYLEPSLVNTSTDGTALTYFSFDEPVYLNAGVEYAIVLLAESIDYNVYVAETGEFVFGSTEKKITKQPSMGSMFKSQNGSTWEPVQNFDMSFELHRAEFVPSGNAILENAHPPFELLNVDAISATSGSTRLVVHQPDHGFKRTDRARIMGLDSSTSYAGILGANIMGVKVVDSSDNDFYTITAGTAATSTGAIGGSTMFAEKNIVFEQFTPSIQTMIPTSTDISLSGKFTTAQSIAEDVPTKDYKKDALFSTLSLGENNYFNDPVMVPSKRNSDQNLGVGINSTTFAVAMNTIAPVVSPVLDMQRASLWTVHNRIDFQDSGSATYPRGGAAGTYHTPLVYVPETDNTGGTSIAKHVTRPVVLEADAVGLRMTLAANRPTGSDFRVYYKAVTDDVAFEDVKWTEIIRENELPRDEDRITFRDYTYLIGGQGGNLPPFSKFIIKIVMHSTNNARVPVFKDLRVIAMGA